MDLKIKNIVENKIAKYNELTSINKQQNNVNKNKAKV